MQDLPAEGDDWKGSIVVERRMQSHTRGRRGKDQRESKELSMTKMLKTRPNSASIESLAGAEEVEDS